MSSNETLVASALILYLQNKNKNKMKRKIWTKNWFQKRDDFSHINLLKELKFSPNDWNNYMRMNEKTYLELLSLVTPLIQKQDTYFRKAISPYSYIALFSYRKKLRGLEILNDNISSSTRENYS